MSQIISEKVSDVIKDQQQKFKDSSTSAEAPSDTAKGKLRYLAGSCMHIVSVRLQKTVMSTIGKLTKDIKLGRRLADRKQSVLHQLRIREESADSQDSSMKEIFHKLNATRGLFIVNDSLYQFFFKKQMNFCKHFINVNRKST